MEIPPEDPFLKPWIREARGALQALQRGKIEAALDLAARIPETAPDQAAWRAYVRARIAERAGDPETAELLLIQSATFCDTALPAEGAGGAADADAGADDADASGEPRRRLARLKALCYQQLGSLEVQRKRIAHALRAYEAAASQRAVDGTPAERWETASARAAAHRLAGDHQAALPCALESIALAETVPQQSERLSAQSWFALALSLLPLGRFHEAVGATTNARTYWVQEGQTAAVARVLELEAKALLQWARAEREARPDAARTHIAQARAQLEAAADRYAEAADAESTDRCRTRAERLGGRPG